MVTSPIDSTIGNYFTQWAIAHPNIAWAIEHPLMAIGLLLLVIFALAGLFKAVGRGIEKIWIWLLTTPFKLIQPMFRPLWGAIRWRSLSFGESRFGSINNNDVSPNDNRIEQIISRLDAIHQEQETLLRELATLTKSPAQKNENEPKSTDRSASNSIQLPKFDR